MMALTLYQPWASLAIGGWKPYEFRPRPAPKAYEGRRFVIHAGKRPIVPCEVVTLLRDLHDGVNCGGLSSKCIPFLERALREPQIVPLGAGLGTAVLGQCVLSSKLWPKQFVNDSDRLDKANWALPLTNIRRFEPIVPARGFQTWWTWPFAEMAQ